MLSRLIRRSIDNTNIPRLGRLSCPVRTCGGYSDRAAPFNLMFESYAGADRVGGEQGLPPPRDGAGHLRQLQERARLVAAQAAVRHRPGRQGVPQRDQPAELHLPLPRVRADGDRVLLPPGRVDEVVRVLAQPAQELVQQARHQVRQPPAARAGQGGTRPLLHRHDRHRVPVPVLRRAAGTGRRRPPRGVRPDAARRRTAARRSWRTSTRTPGGRRRRAHRPTPSSSG